MNFISNRWACKTLTMLLPFAVLCSSFSAQQSAPQAAQQPSDYTFRVQSNLVLVNVTVRDKNGNFLRGLKPTDFTILEDGKPQKVDSFDVEDVAQAKPLTGPLPPAASPNTTPATGAPNPYKDRRLIVLFFDLSAMEPDEIDHAVTSAQHYVDTQMAPADLVSIVSLG